MTDVKAAFDEYDVDANGKIDLIEFRAIVAKLGLLLDPAEAEGLFDIIDSDETGFVEFEEFEHWYADRMSQT
jgi:calmodulin